MEPTGCKRSRAARFVPALITCMVWAYVVSCSHGPRDVHVYVETHNGTAAAPLGTLWDEFFAKYWPMTLAMIAGSLIAGSTPLGGGVVAFPVAVLVIGFKPSEGRDFTVLIQSVGMNAAAFLISVYRSHLLDFTLIATFVVGGVPGMLLGLALDLPPFQVVLTFQTLVIEFAIVFFYLNVLAPRSSPSAIPTKGPVHRTSADVAAAEPAASPLHSRLAAVTMAVAAFVGGFLTASVGSGSDIILYAYGLLGWNLLVPEAQRFTDTQLTASSVVVMGALSLVTAVCRALARQLSSEVLYCWGATAWLVCFGAPLGSLLLTPGLRAQLRLAFYLLALAQFTGFAVLKVGADPVAWGVFAGMTGMLLLLLALHALLAIRKMRNQGMPPERLSPAVVSAAQYIGQGNDGNPHNWDRRRRCDGTQYSPPCGVCEGYGGIPHGDENDQVTLTSCTPVNRTGASEPVRPVWSARMTMAPYYAVQIGPKKDPFCFQAIPGNSSAGELCYQRQTGSQLYDMTGAFDSLRFDVDLSTRVGNVTSGVIAHDKYLWIVNHLPWYALGIKQCICTEPKEGGDPRTASVFPLALHWVDNLRYVGRERLGIEYAWQELELEHWAFGPHHVWTRPDTGSIIRMWQPYNGLQVMPNGTLPSAVDGRLLGVPPPECTAASHLTAKIGCNASGYPKPKPAAAAVVEAPPEHDGERWRAVEQVPRGEYRGASFDAMSQVLSGWLRRGGAATRPCEEWEVEELQQLQATLYLVRHATYDEVYRAANDSRALAKDVDALQTDWRQLNAAAEAEGLGEMHRDGHCHEAAMWWVHHTREDAKALLRQQGVTIPLLSPLRHACPDGASAAAQQVCGAYDYKVSCASCHSAPTAASSPQAQPTAVSLARRLLGF